ncbi:MAG: Wzt carbohydrate-binding domain-containing protein [Bryobacteraceae bacterium]
MAIAFKKVTLPPIQGLSISAPNGAFIGIVGEDGSGKTALLRLAAGLDKPIAGSVSAGESRLMVGVNDALGFPPVDVLVLDHALARHDILVRNRARITLERLRRGGTTILMASHDEQLLRGFCDELWWIAEGKVAARGDPATVLDAYRGQVADKLRAWGETLSATLATNQRRGDGRAEIVSVETLGAQGKATLVWRSGEAAEVRVSVRFNDAVTDPVIGILIRNRIGLDVYGTNTELENLKLGPRTNGETVRLTFRFLCELCPQEYTLTVASHDPNGVRHDWLEEAVAFTVTDSRYTAGVANLKARVSLG